MSKAGRSIDADRAATRDVILGKRSPYEGNVNWLGHRLGTGNARMDDMLVGGVRRADLPSSGRNPEPELYHLRKEHGLTISQDDEGYIRFDRAALGIVEEPVPVADEYDDEAASAAFGISQRNREVERAAIERVTAKLASDGWSVTSTERDGCGYDLRCLRQSEEMHVEVKGRRGSGAQFVLTEGEFRQARDNPRFVLMLVSDALGVAPKVERFTGSELLRAFAFTPLQYVARRTAT